MNDDYPGLRAALMNLRGESDLRGAEIGVATGYHAEDILAELDMEHLFLIDPFIPYMDHEEGEVWGWFREAWERIGPYRWQTCISMMFTSSEEAARVFAPDTMDFVYIDGDHRYDAVVRDLQLWWDKVRIGGLFCGHDYRRPKVARRHFGTERNLTTAVQDFAAEKGRELHTDPDVSMDWWVWK